MSVLCSIIIDRCKPAGLKNGLQSLANGVEQGLKNHGISCGSGKSHSYIISYIATCS